MKRYLIFAWNDYQAQGGMGDCTGQADTPEDAIQSFNADKEHGFDCITIHDMEIDKEVWSLEMCLSVWKGECKPSPFIQEAYDNLIKPRRDEGVFDE